MSRAWLLVALDNVLPDLLGADRDRIAALILEALPRQEIALQIGNVLLFWNDPSTAREIGHVMTGRVLSTLGAECP